MSDFPVTLNPFAVVNSVFAGLPTNLLGGFTVAGDDPATALPAVGVWLGLAALGTAPAGSSYYFTLNPNDLPLLEPLRLPVRIINAITGWNLPTPIADALQPAAKILVNIAYTDVVTPADIAANPSLADDYEPYDRTFSPAELSIPTPLYSRWPLTFDEYLRVPGDTLTALLTGIVYEIRDLTDHSPEEATFSINAKGVAPVVTEGASPRLPDLPKPGAGERQVLADIDASIDDISSKASAAAAKIRADTSGSGKTLSRILKPGADDKAADVKVERKTPVKDALQKAGKDLKQSVDTVSAKVKKALKPKRSVAAD